MAAAVKIMGIVNVNSDSFFSGSRVASGQEFCARVERLFAGGADVVDIGACSSRPGSEYPGVEEEWRRLEPVLETIRERYLGSRTPEDTPGSTGHHGKHLQLQLAMRDGTPSAVRKANALLAGYPRFSIDTFSSEIVRRAHGIIGPFIVNDITAGQSDARLLPLVAQLNLPYIAMHNLQPPHLDGCRIRKIIRSRDGENVVENVLRFFRGFEKRAAAAGLQEWILDPGFGFGKDVEENLELLDRLDELKVFGHEILAGISRKRMTYERQGRRPEDDETLAETRRLQNIAVSRGATWLRVHDI